MKVGIDKGCGKSCFLLDLFVILRCFGITGFIVITRELELIKKYNTVVQSPWREMWPMGELLNLKM